jgi:glycosyltransferase involved in cell wall biosynthesis
MEHCINTLLTGGEEVEIIIVDDGSAKDRNC